MHRITMPRFVQSMTKGLVGAWRCSAQSTCRASAECSPYAHTNAGDLLTLLSAFLYGVYTIVIRKALPDDDRVSTAQFFGFIGLYALLLLSPVVWWMHETGDVDLFDIKERALRLTVINGMAPLLKFLCFLPRVDVPKGVRGSKGPLCTQAFIPHRFGASNKRHIAKTNVHRFYAKEFRSKPQIPHWS